jgi:hypothetical protein
MDGALFEGRVRHLLAEIKEHIEKYGEEPAMLGKTITAEYEGGITITLGFSRPEGELKH